MSDIIRLLDEMSKHKLCNKNIDVLNILIDQMDKIIEYTNDGELQMCRNKMKDVISKNDEKRIEKK